MTDAIDQCDMAAAYVLDFAEKNYSETDWRKAAFIEMASALREGEHVHAYHHGELDDILKRPLFGLSKP